MKIKSSKIVDGIVTYSFGDVVFENSIATIEDKDVAAIKEHKGITLLEEEIKNDTSLDHKKELMLLNKVDLIEIAKTSNLPEDEYSKLNKNQLIDYIASKIA